MPDSIWWIITLTILGYAAYKTGMATHYQPTGRCKCADGWYVVRVYDDATGTAHDENYPCHRCWSANPKTRSNT